MTQTNPDSPTATTKLHQGHHLALLGLADELNCSVDDLIAGAVVMFIKASAAERQQVVNEYHSWAASEGVQDVVASGWYAQHIDKFGL